MAQNKKTEENNYLNAFLSSPIGKEWQGEYNITSHIETEQPDFIFDTGDNKKIGFEITRFFMKSKHCEALRFLKTIGNKLCQYCLKKYNVPISIIIDKYDRKKWEAKTLKEHLERVYNPGFIDIFNEKEIKSKIEPVIDKKIRELQTFPKLIKETIEINGEYLIFSICGFPNIDGKFDCNVNNACISWPDPFDKLQEEIDKKNKKYDGYLKKCDECFLLVYIPNVTEGNYCHFTEEITNHKFNSKFESVFICTDNNCIKLKTHYTLKKLFKKWKQSIKKFKKVSIWFQIFLNGCKRWLIGAKYG